MIIKLVILFFILAVEMVLNYRLDVSSELECGLKVYSLVVDDEIKVLNAEESRLWHVSMLLKDNTLKQLKHSFPVSIQAPLCTSKSADPGTTTSASTRFLLIYLTVLVSCQLCWNFPAVCCHHFWLSIRLFPTTCSSDRVNHFIQQL